MSSEMVLYILSASPPARVVWIEIKIDQLSEAELDVATREGGVD